MYFAERCGVNVTLAVVVGCTLCGSERDAAVEDCWGRWTAATQVDGRGQVVVGAVWVGVGVGVGIM